MKQARQVIARWVAKFTAPVKTPVATTATTDLRPIDVEQLRQVAGARADAPVAQGQLVSKVRQHTPPGARGWHDQHLSPRSSRIAAEFVDR